MSFFFCALAGAPLLAELAGPGEYEGYYVTDRWGRRVFHAGPRHFFLSEAAAAQLKEHAGVPLKLAVEEMNQPKNPGGARIEKVRKVTKLPAPRLGLDAIAKAESVVREAGVELTLVVRNASDAKVELGPGRLALVLVTDSPFPNSAIGYKDPDDRAYWYYSYDFAEIDKQGKGGRVRVACRDVPLPWTPEDFARKGKGVSVGPQKPTDKDPGTYRPLVLDPGGWFQFDATAGAELLPGKYEVFLYERSGHRSHEPGTISRRVKFDVAEQARKG